MVNGWGMMVNKCAKFESHRSMDIENISGGTKTLMWISKSIKGHNLVKMPQSYYVKMLSSTVLLKSVMVVEVGMKYQSYRLM